MSYLVLARKYRPQSFTDVVGQLPVVKTLHNSLLRKRVAHAILFSGVRGVGKTTLARIMAKAINCQGDTEHKPCNKCRVCKEMTGGQSLDLHEIDGASNRGIQEIRELKERIRFLPTSSQYKIIIIDEVHMLTTEAFNALLKTLEEPPDHVYFMFATTELHKIPITILSRCQRYELKRIGAAELTEHFQKISAEEKITIEPAALNLIVREAEGSVRDGLSLLDQMFSYGDDTISLEDVIQVLGLTDRNILLTISEALLKGDRTSALNTLDGAFEYGIDLKRFTTDLLECFRTLLLVKIGGCREMLDLPQEEIDHFHRIGENFSLETIHSKLNLLLDAVEKIRFTTQPRLALETAFLKVIESSNIVSVAKLLSKIDGIIEHEGDADTPPGNAPLKKKETDSTLKSPQDQQPPPPSEPPAYLRKQEFPPAVEAVKGVPPQPPSQSPENTATTPQETVREEVVLPDKSKGIAVHPQTHDVRRDWQEFAGYVKDRKVWMAQDLQRAELAKEVDGELHLHYNDAATCTLLRSKENRKLLTEFVLDFFQKDLTVRFILPDAGGNGKDDSDPDSPHRQRQQLANDPLVQMAVEIFNGQVGNIRIGPRSR